MGTDGDILKFLQDFAEHPATLEYFAQITNKEMLKWVNDEKERESLSICNSIILDFPEQELLTGIVM
eukprot:CAMPEP_0170546394 /NCGR_PEP_ID=MMETSP0211-20121228/4752_1 /TAXON_ID=311385 /ORGANISM="Pseudokeronopsis sp., Strain OXSARD2" /LENGTH=66 /DNA_ID=CAMNT_0010850843 /DNA_START=823 /DNA_END=1020 /DNA_ORIENTATION=+